MNGTLWNHIAVIAPECRNSIGSNEKPFRTVPLLTEEAKSSRARTRARASLVRRYGTRGWPIACRAHRLHLATTRPPYYDQTSLRSLVASGAAFS